MADSTPEVPKRVQDHLDRIKAARIQRKHKHAQARKRARQAEKRRRHNASRRSAMRTYIKNTLKAIQSGDREAALQAFRIAVPYIDRAASKGLIHPNKAARHKRRLHARLKAMAG